MIAVHTHTHIEQSTSLSIRLCLYSSVNGIIKHLPVSKDPQQLVPEQDPATAVLQRPSK